MGKGSIVVNVWQEFSTLLINVYDTRRNVFDMEWDRKDGGVLGAFDRSATFRSASLRITIAEAEISLPVKFRLAWVDFQNLKECKKLYNVISRFFGFIFHTDRIGNLNRIRAIGLDKFKEEKMTDDRP